MPLWKFSEPDEAWRHRRAARMRKAPGRAGAFVVLGIAAGVTPAR